MRSRAILLVLSASCAGDPKDPRDDVRPAESDGRDTERVETDAGPDADPEPLPDTGPAAATDPPDTARRDSEPSPDTDPPADTRLASETGPGSASCPWPPPRPETAWTDTVALAWVETSDSAADGRCFLIPLERHPDCAGGACPTFATKAASVGPGAATGHCTDVHGRAFDVVGTCHGVEGPQTYYFDGASGCLVGVETLSDLGNPCGRAFWYGAFVQGGVARLAYACHTGGTAWGSGL